MLDSADSLVGCGHPEVPTPPGRQEELQYVVDGDDADHPVLIVYDRSCREVEVGHLPDDRVQVSVGPDRNRVDVGNFTDARRRRALHQPDDRRGAGETPVFVHRVDDRERFGRDGAAADLLESVGNDRVPGQGKEFQGS